MSQIQLLSNRKWSKAANINFYKGIQKLTSKMPAHHEPQEVYQKLATKPPNTFVAYGVPNVTAVKLPNGHYTKHSRRGPSKTSAAPFNRQCNESQDWDRLLKPAELETLMNSMFPPCRWKAGGKVFSSSVSLKPAKQSDLIDLAQDVWNAEYKSVEEPNFDVDEEHEEFLWKAFDELTRQITLEKPIAGVLLRRIKNFISQEIKNRREMWQSVNAFSIRKVAQLRQESLDLNAALVDAENDKLTASETLENARLDTDGLSGQFDRRQTASTIHHNDETNQLQKELKKQMIALKALTDVKM